MRCCRQVAAVMVTIVGRTMEVIILAATATLVTVILPQAGEICRGEGDIQVALVAPPGVVLHGVVLHGVVLHGVIPSAFLGRRVVVFLSAGKHSD